ncbi:MAG: multidrug efflux SMR transporter [Methanomassiliicoccaceae archaeon]|nr:multidrug efflux SMR transporter [Methanomassiliicoccaceae archaeon]
MYDERWRFVMVGGLFEIVWAIAMKYSDGFADLFWDVVVIVFIIMSMVMLSKAIASGIPLGAAYAVWVGIGAAGTFVYGIMFMDEPLSVMRVMFVVMVIAGITGLQRTSSGSLENEEQ